MSTSLENIPGPEQRVREFLRKLADWEGDDCDFIAAVGVRGTNSYFVLRPGDVRDVLAELDSYRTGLENGIEIKHAPGSELEWQISYRNGRYRAAGRTLAGALTMLTRWLERKDT